MSYTTLKLELESEYSNQDLNELKKLISNKKFNQYSFEPINNYLLKNTNTKLIINFPGYLAKINRQNEIIQPDFRVDIVKNNFTNTLSHTNIIVDLYTKTIDILNSEKVDIKDFKTFLIDIAKNGDGFNASIIKNLNIIEYSNPDEGLVEFVNDIHSKKGKKFNKDVNNWGYSFEELAVAMTWIGVQEDVNHPIENNKQGRKMPFYRYLETVYCAYWDYTAAYLNKHSLYEIIDRALIHGGPPPEPWDDTSEIDYDSINNLT